MNIPAKKHTEERLEKIARMVLYEVPQDQIARAMGVSESRISQILATQEFQEIVQTFAADTIERAQTLNDGWDQIEALALNNLLEVMQWNQDPQLSLRAATVANRATRRGQFGSRPIDGRAGARVVLHLSQNFINKVENNCKSTKSEDMINGSMAGVGTEDTDPNVTSGSIKERGELMQQRADFLTPDRVEKLLMPLEEEDKIPYFPDMAVTVGD